MITEAPLVDAAERLRSGDLSPAAYLDRVRERIESDEPEIHAFVDDPDWDLLEGQIASLTDRFPDPATRPQLFGVPVGIKDIFHVEGYPTRGGTSLPPSAFEGPEADAVHRLRQAGAVVLGKTVTTEFAYMEPGPTRNPHDTDHTPGGSSSGSAAAVSAGFCPIALGSQTIGSVIRPAAFCGIVGFKPSYDRIPIGGVLPLAKSVDHVGMFTQDVAGMQLAAPVVCDDWRSLPNPDRKPRVGVPAGPYLNQASDAGQRAFEATVDVLERDGFGVERVEVFGDIDEINDRHTDLVAGEAALAHHEWFEAYQDEYAPASAELVTDGRKITIGRLSTARASRTAVRQRLQQVMDDHGIDVWISPAAPGPAPSGIGDTGDPAMNLPWTHAGVPALTVPAGTADGLPVGLQCTTRFGADERLLAWGDVIADTLGDSA